jgi:hypothetical protein
MAAMAMIDRFIHDSEILSLKGDSYRLREKDLDTSIGAKSAEIGRPMAFTSSPSAAERRTSAGDSPTSPGEGGLDPVGVGRSLQVDLPGV